MLHSTLVSLALGVGASLAGPAQAQTQQQRQFDVLIQLVPATPPGCTSSSGPAAVQVRCAEDVFVEIAPIGNAAPRFIRGTWSSVDSLLADLCRTDAIGASANPLVRDAGCGNGRRPLAGEDETAAWQLEDRLYADSTGVVRSRDSDGTVTALHIAHADARRSTVELLVSF